jgi:hypothetical protein
LKLNGTHQLLVHNYDNDDDDDDVNILGRSYILYRKNTKALTVASKCIGLEVNGHVSRSECRTKSNVKTENCSFEGMEEFRYLGKP